MRHVTLKLPGEFTEGEIKLYLALKLFEESKLTLGQASSLAGYSKRAFMEILGKHGIPVLNHAPEDLEKDIENA